MASKLSFFLSAAITCADEMRASASEIEEELGAKDLPEPQEREVAEVCSAFVSARRDVVEEVDILRARELPARSSKVRSRVDRIVSWLGSGIPRLDSAIETLEPAPGDPPDQRFVYVLLADSAAEFHRFYARVCSAANDYRRALREEAAAGRA